MPDLETRKARLSDVPAMLELINSYAHAGLMLPRTELEMCENIRDFTVALRNGQAAGPRLEQQLVGCGALHFYTPQMGELRSLAVSEKLKTAGVGRRVVEALLEEGRAFGLDVVFAFTYVTGFFEKCGFQVVDRGSLPLKAWKDCLRCPHFSRCDEVPVVCLLSPEAREAHRTSVHDGVIHLANYIQGRNGNGDEITVPTPAAFPDGGFQGR
jgi:amino-acid N-acetyltransferase